DEGKDGGEHEQDDEERKTDLMRSEEHRDPEEVQGELHPPQLHRPAAWFALPDTPARDGDEDIEQRPYRSEQPRRRIEGGFGEAGIPVAARREEAEKDPAAKHEYEEQDQRRDAVHGVRSTIRGTSDRRSGR